jgi:hypothetical protein
VTAWDLSEASAQPAIERAVALLPPGPRAGVALDEVSASLLEGKFTIVHDARGRLLAGDGATASRPGAIASERMSRVPMTAPPAARPSFLVYLAVAAGVAALVATVVVFAIVRVGRSPAPGAASAHPAGPTPVAQINSPATPTQPPGAPQPTSALNLPECREYLRVLECIYRTTPKEMRDKYMKQARDDTRFQNAEYCTKHAALNRKVQRQMGCK